jgi:poly-beta-hydroxyalkanoate depolymerase
MKYLHLDSEYRNRWVEFHLADGSIEDSRLKNWRQVAWEQVVCIVVHMVGEVHQVDCKNPEFRAFMNFRWGGREATFDKKGKYAGYREIKIWTVGWTDGRNCFLKDIDFYTGEYIKGYVAPLSQFMGHVHPAVRQRVLEG